MRDYKVHQKIYNRTQSHEDLIENWEFTENHDPQAIIRYAVSYLTEDCPSVEYPGKSYAVAVLYSHYIEKYFGTPLLESLDSGDLMDGMDKYFVPYSQSREVYDSIMAALPGDYHPDLTLGQIKMTHQFFMKEFGVAEVPMPASSGDSSSF